MSRRLINYLNTLLIFTTLLFGCQAPPRQSEPFEFIILQMNDVYEIAPLEGGRKGGLARVATILDSLEAENPNTIAVLSGDFLSPSFIGTLRMENGSRVAGLQMVETLNALGLDYVTFGNHEFDFSSAEVLEKRMDQSQFRYVSCNALYRNGDTLRPFMQRIGGVEEPVPPYIVHEFSGPGGGTVRVAMLGVVLPFNKAPYVEYLPVTESFRKAYRQARTESDVVLGITHLSEQQDIELARNVRGIPLFMGGHDHSQMSHYVENTIIAKADANAKTIYIHRVTFDPTSGMTRIRSTLREIDDRIPEAPDVQSVVDRWEKLPLELMKEMGYRPEQQLMTATEPLICTEALIRTQATNYGQLTARSFEAIWPGADVYLLNSGGMRLDDNLSGVVTAYDVLRTFPYGGKIVRMELPGEVLRKVLKTGLVDNKGEGGYLQLWQGSYADGQCLIQGRPLDEQQTYAVVMPKFLAEGKEHNLEMLGDFDHEAPSEFEIGGEEVRNDVRDIVIHFMRQMD